MSNSALFLREPAEALAGAAEEAAGAAAAGAAPAAKPSTAFVPRNIKRPAPGGGRSIPLPR